MKKVFVYLMLAAIPGTVCARAVSFDPTQCRSLSISLSAAAPTQVFTNDFDAKKSWVVNTSSNVIYIVGLSTSAANPLTTNSPFSISLTTGSAYVPANFQGSTQIQPTTLYLDGPNDSFTGPLWAVAVGQGGSTLTSCRTH